MCGICGIWGEANIGVVKTMVSVMHHRGPDDDGFFNNERISMGMSRLAIIDITPSGHQPMSTPDKNIWIIFNGEVFNFQSERQQLEQLGYLFVSNSDTEVILRLYEHYGDCFLNKLRGMFALAIYDKRGGHGKERLLLARDQIGIKPLLYAEIGRGMIFASEMKAMLASGFVSSEIDTESLRQLLTFGSVQQPRTFLKHVKMLPPAHKLIIDRNGLHIKRYWELAINRRPEVRDIQYPEQVEALSTALKESVKLHMISDVPLGAFLSGGVDSAVLVALMSQVTNSHIYTYSVGFDSEGLHIDESQDAFRTAKHLGTNHNHVHVRGKDVREHIKHIAYSLDQPSVDGVNSYFVSKAARPGVTVAISGTGGDELFAGYPWFQIMVEAHERARQEEKRIEQSFSLERYLQNQFFDPLVRFPGGNRFNNFRATGFLGRFAAIYQIFSPSGAARIVAKDLRASGRIGRMPQLDLAGIDELRSGSAIDRVTGLCLRGYTNNQLLRDIDVTSMIHSLEVRVPYLDREIVDLALSLPDSTKLGRVNSGEDLYTRTYRDSGAKKILIDAGKSLLPKDFDIQPKRGFSMPFEAWLRGPLRDVLIDSLSSETVQARGWFDSGKTVELRDSFLNNEDAAWAQPWLLMMTELWARQVLDGCG